LQQHLIALLSATAADLICHLAAKCMLEWSVVCMYQGGPKARINCLG
jgi:hypothetical protein